MVCIVASGDFFSTYGGGQVYVRSIVDELAKRLVNAHSPENAVTVISCDVSFPAEPRKQKYGKTSIYEINPQGNGTSEIRIKELLAWLRPDIVHINGQKPLFARLCKELGIPSIVTAHHGGIVCPAGTLLNDKDEICQVQACHQNCLPCYLANICTGRFCYPLLKHCSEENYVKIGRRLKGKKFMPFLTPIGEAALSVKEKLERWNQLKDAAPLFIAPSDAMREALVRNGAHETKVIVLPHGIVLPTDSPMPSSAPQTPLRFYYAGRICHGKGIHILLKAFHPLAAQAELHLFGGAGNRADERYMKQLQRKYRREPHIIWHGKLPHAQVYDATSGFSAMLHPTIMLESFGLNIAEALAQGKWVIATRCGGAEMQIQDQNNGTLVPPNDVCAFRAAIENFIARPRSPKVSAVVSIEKHTDKLLEAYSQIREANLPETFTSISE
ncbi:MAG: glycosyltransferase family 4 protein [Bacteroidales bacterium]|nr:glycosyltransferase family 4 protein [Bacteroidales bacterium]